MKQRMRAAGVEFEVDTIDVESFPWAFQLFISPPTVKTPPPHGESMLGMDTYLVCRWVGIGWYRRMYITA